jgi:hypothetical protein
LLKGFTELDILQFTKLYVHTRDELRYILDPKPVHGLHKGYGVSSALLTGDTNEERLFNEMLRSEVLQYSIYFQSSGLFGQISTKSVENVKPRRKKWIGVGLKNLREVSDSLMER